MDFHGVLTMLHIHFLSEGEKSEGLATANGSMFSTQNLLCPFKIVFVLQMRYERGSSPAIVKKVCDIEHECFHLTCEFVSNCGSA